MQLSREVDGRSQILGTLGPGEVFGLLGVIQGKPQYATVEATKATTVYSLETSRRVARLGQVGAD